MSRGIVFVFVASLLSAAAAPAVALDLYDGALNTTPNAQGWLAYGSADFQNYASTSGGQTQLDTSSASGLQAGFSNHTIFGSMVNGAFPTLDRTTGFVLSFRVKLTSETHDSPNRAGFSVIAIGSDKKGIELGFWADQVFAQDDAPTLFTKDESAAFNTTTDYVNYDLLVGASTYELKANGASLLSGNVRDYAAFVPPFPAPDPYETPNYIFLGDDTTSARGNASIARVSVAVPEPASVALFGIVGLLATRRRCGCRRR
jgi:hypothetical protein